MSEKYEITSLETDTENILNSTLTGLLEGLTGVAVSSRKDLILSISHIFQRMRGGQFLSVLLDEWQKCRKKGKVKEDYQYTEQHKVCLQELLDFLENDSPDEQRFKILKQIFLVAASEKTTDRDSLLPHQFMKIARTLTGGEIVVLTTVWQLAIDHNGVYESHYGAQKWLGVVTEASSIKFIELVEIYEQSLMDEAPRRKRTGYQR